MTGMLSYNFEDVNNTDFTQILKMIFSAMFALIISANMRTMYMYLFFKLCVET